MATKAERVARRPLSITLALDSLRDQCELVKEAEALVQERRAERDRLIVDAMAAGISYRRLAATTGLSQHRLWRISVDAQEDQQ